MSIKEIIQQYEKGKILEHTAKMIVCIFSSKISPGLKLLFIETTIKLAVQNLKQITPKQYEIGCIINTSNHEDKIFINRT
jgi:hypothetical protein